MAEVYTVSGLTSRIRQAIAAQFRDVVVQGEVSNPKFYPSGHLYFTLKDESATIRAVMFNATGRLGDGLLTEGVAVLCRGRVDVYEKRGEYQLIVDMVELKGLGLLQIKFERLKQKLLLEGLFDTARKKPLPFLPSRIGMVTSPAGAAVRDMLKVLARKFDNIPVLIYPVRVQGEAAPQDIVDALGYFNGSGDVDVIIVARGGGSPEDLAPFNEEIVARAISASRIPVVSGVGHEIDYTIADFTADARAPTPTAAADMVVKDREELRSVVSEFRVRLQSFLRNLLEKARLSLYGQVLALRDRKDLFASHRLYVDELANRLISAMALYRIGHAKGLEGLRQRLDDLNPANILKRGYSITARASTGEIITSAASVGDGEDLRITLDEGALGAVVTCRESASEGRRKKAPRRP